MNHLVLIHFQFDCIAFVYTTKYKLIPFKIYNIKFEFIIQQTTTYNAKEFTVLTILKNNLQNS